MHEAFSLCSINRSRRRRPHLRVNIHTLIKSTIYITLAAQSNMVCNKPIQQLIKTTGVLLQIASNNYQKVTSQNRELASLGNQITSTKLIPYYNITHLSITTILSRCYMVIIAAQKVKLKINILLGTYPNWIQNIKRCLSLLRD